MNDEFLRKIVASTAAFNKMKSITDLAGVFTPFSGVDLAIQRSLSNLSYQDPVIDAITKSSLALNAQYFEPTKFNPVMAAFGSVTQMMHQMQFQQPVYNPVNLSVVDLIRDFSKYNVEAVSPLLGISQITSKLLNDIKFDTFNWRETYPDLFTEEHQIEDSSEYSKFNKNLDKLMDLSIVDEDSTLSDGVAVSVNLDTYVDDTFSGPLSEEIFAIANQAIEEVAQKNIDYEAIFNKLLLKLDKIVHNPYTVNLVTGIVLIVISHYYEEYNETNETNIKTEHIAPTYEIILTEQLVKVKQTAHDKSKTIDILPIGVEVEVNKRFKKWVKIIYTKNYVPQIGYCRNEELKISK
ncbi:hypothetical protein EQG63_11195 [Flavobacterium amnicola]|uniref:Uncharacterized protein n=1 Tax=Flavobacterium amnicola TaxID=2506422 RepID=A0A4Q1K0W0_9FLAO|nr:hypothetical protein [Flavobacterium amnicola]RXR17346.1 hypothetical protein EQG63_11195 [Flavobacterium amnicola]